jgi:hypothetical protein
MAHANVRQLLSYVRSATAEASDCDPELRQILLGTRPKKTLATEVPIIGHA